MLNVAAGLYAGSQFWKIHTRLYDNMNSGTSYDPLKGTDEKPGYAATTAQVVVDQPSGSTVEINIASQQDGEWSTGLCKCCIDPKICLCSGFCTACYAAGLAQRLSENCLLGCCPGGIAVMRTKFRLENDIQGSLLEDAVCSCFAPPCVLCQLGREMDPEKYPKVCCGNC